ncbi:MAG: BamA/TamA family outer membrane protein, partial [Pelagibacteraceae bacterium]
NSFGQDFIGSFKFYTSAINGLSNEDVRLSKRTFLSTNRLRGFESGKVGPKDGLDYVGGNYAIATNFDLNLPNLLPESTKTDVGLFLDLGNVWGVDYDKTIDDSSKLRSSAGITTNWLSPVGPMSFIFSQNISKASTDVTESFNFRLGTTF